MYKRQKLVTATLRDIKPYDTIYIHGRRYGVNKITFTPNKRVRRPEMNGGDHIADIVELEVRPWLQWKAYLKAQEMVMLCAGFCEHGGMHIVTKAQQDHATVRPPKRITIAILDYVRAPYIKKKEEK